MDKQKARIKSPRSKIRVQSVRKGEVLTGSNDWKLQRNVRQDVLCCGKYREDYFPRWQLQLHLKLEIKSY